MLHVCGCHAYVRARDNSIALSTSPLPVKFSDSRTLNLDKCPCTSSDCNGQLRTEGGSELKGVSEHIQYVQSANRSIELKILRTRR